MIKFSRERIYAVMQFLILMGLCWWVYHQNQAVSIAKPNTEKLQCVSYAPYYQTGQSPLIQGIMVSQAQIESDLQALAKISQCVRTYSVGQGLDYVPAAAKKTGLQVYLGAWIGWTDSDNQKEVDLATKVANSYPDTVKAIIIGNEVLLRQEQTEDKLAEYLQRAKRQTTIPITYADVWEFWLKHPKLEAGVDFITVHVLPYWEDDPVPIAQATQHANNVMHTLQSKFHKPLMIGETGWPSSGRQRHGAKPSLVNQARYIREFVITAKQNQWQYNIIEAIDQPWKRVLEGTVGAYWGLFSADLTAKFSMLAPVAERHDGLKPILFAFIGGLLFLGLSIRVKQPSTLNIAHLLLGASTGLIFCLQYTYIIASGETWFDRLPLIALLVVGWIGLISLATINTSEKKRSTVLPWILGTLLIVSLILSYYLYHDGRYRDFPVALFGLASIVLLLARCLLSAQLSLAKWRYVPLILGVIYAGLVFSLEPDNTTACIWSLLIILLAGANWPTKVAHSSH